MNRSLVLVFAASLSLSACSKNEAPAAAPAAATPAATTAGATPAAPQVRSFEGAANSGKVRQVLQAGSYTYTEVDVGSGVPVWIAGTHIDVKPGDTVQWGEYSVMQNFAAKSIGRTFERILFVNNWGPAGAATVAMTPHGTPPTAPRALPANVDPAQSGVVKSVAEAGGYSYVEVQQGDRTVWVAAMATPMKVGDKVAWDGGTEMRNFNAKSVGRTFDRIIFASAIAVQR